ncbi:hypothetical protein C7M84_021277 [Penaeus vannamei]|uniref:Uncharacterized protein n=1 Tax=Penaeus vannamei TaxID=6689 RepID=A0A423S9Y6_PENVA|nr:hypothetical protein C7M84_021277 [Penaeus vannamei]
MLPSSSLSLLSSPSTSPLPLFRFSETLPLPTLCVLLILSSLPSLSPLFPPFSLLPHPSLPAFLLPSPLPSSFHIFCASLSLLPLFLPLFNIFLFLACLSLFLPLFSSLLLSPFPPSSISPSLPSPSSNPVSLHLSPLFSALESSSLRSALFVSYLILFLALPSLSFLLHPLAFSHPLLSASLLSSPALFSPSSFAFPPPTSFPSLRLSFAPVLPSLPLSFSSSPILSPSSSHLSILPPLLPSFSLASPFPSAPPSIPSLSSPTLLLFSPFSLPPSLLFSLPILTLFPSSVPSPPSPLFSFSLLSLLLHSSPFLPFRFFLRTQSLSHLASRFLITLFPNPCNYFLRFLSPSYHPRFPFPSFIFHLSSSLPSLPCYLYVYSSVRFPPCPLP